MPLGLCTGCSPNPELDPFPVYLINTLFLRGYEDLFPRKRSPVLARVRHCSPRAEWHITGACVSAGFVEPEDRDKGLAIG